MILAYTDGACRGNPGLGGFGAVLILPNGERREICGGEAQTTNNRMELMAVIVALENSSAELPIQIWSDSNYVVQGITEWIHGWKRKNWKNTKNVELWQRLDALTKNRIIDWQWLKGHAGHIGNEYADKLANQGIDNLSITNFNINIIPENMNNINPNNPPLTNIEQLFFSPDEPPNMGDYPPFDDNFIDNYSENYPMENGNLPTDREPLEKVETAEPISDEPVLKPLSEKEKAKQMAMVLEVFPQFVNNQGIFQSQDDALQQQRPVFNNLTKERNPTFVPLLPMAKNRQKDTRQLILDTETTGFEAQNGDRIIEIGIVELVNRKFTGEKLHVYINPHRKVPESSLKVHGIHDEFLAGMPDFEQVGQAVFEFLAGAELIAHNANFDMGFLQAEFGRLGLDIGSAVRVTDSLLIAKQIYPGQKVSLDALVRKLDVGKKERTFHGALLDAEILAEVYLAMTGGQASLAFDDDMGGGIIQHLRFTTPVQRFVANEDVENAHLAWLQQLVGKNEQLAKNWGLAVDNDKKNAS